MFRIGSFCRPTVRQALRSDLRFCQREFQQLITKFRPDHNRIFNHELSLSRPFKLRQILWREYRAVCSILQRHGFTEANTPLLKELSSNIRGLRTSASTYTQGKQKDESKRQENGNENESDDNPAQFLLKAFIALVFITFALSLTVPDPDRNPAKVSWQEFVHQMLATGEVQQIIVMLDLQVATVILHENAVINGKPVRNRIYKLAVPNVERFEEKLRETERQLGISPENGVQVVFERQKDSVWPPLAATLFIGFILLNVLAAYSKIMKKGIQMPWSSFTKAQFTLVDPRLKGQGRGVRFADIAGMKEAKTEVMEFVDYLKRPEHYRRLGAKVPKGSLLLGPPGCGKTLLAKAVATEANVPFLSMNGSEFIEVVGGLGASRVRDLFKEARKRAPCIVYIDEIDAIGSKRSAMDFGTSEKQQTLLQLLIELDGMASNTGVIMLASTNRAEVLDAALLRPGRFDRHILIGQPTFIERKEIFEVYLNKLKLDNPPTNYSGRLAQLTPTYSGADIANICNEAALHAAGLGQTIITSKDLEYAINRVKFGREKKDRTICDDERKQIAYYQAGRTIVGWMLKHTDALMKVSIIQYTSGIGSMQHFRPASFLTFKEELCDRMTMYLGGKAAELLVFHQNSTQAETDLKKVSAVAYSMITDYGMNESVGEVSFPPLEDNQKRFYSKKLQNIIDLEARNIISNCFATAEQILKENSDNLDKLAEELLKRETLSYDDICQLLGPPPFGHKDLVDMIEFGPDNSATNGEPQSRTEVNTPKERSPDD